MKAVLSLISIFISSVCFSQPADINIERLVKDRNKEIVSGGSEKKLVVFNEKGSIRVPENYSNKRTGTIDSERGEITGPALMVGYDIGYMAGTHIGPLQLKQFNSYYNSVVNGENAWIGVTKDKLVVTIWDPAKRDIAAFPANFWATVKSGDDIVEALKIIFTYKAKTEQ